ncbi:MAG: SGNH/GDSL hydrolase family protein [Halioglobus sp.]|nr:SGNH/GDSL hydrolase family protein [Halioglobus sp.]
MNWLKNVALTGASLLFSFAVGEAAVRGLVASGYMERPGSHNVAQGKEKAEYTRHNASKLANSNPLLTFQYDPADPNINSLGLRGKETTIDKPAGVYRIALLGDSFTYGFSVALSDIFATRLEQRLNEGSPDKRYEVLNFGRAGYGTVQEVELYRTFIRQFAPDEVLLSYVLNDVTDTGFTAELYRANIDYIRTTTALSRKSLLATWIYINYHRFNQDKGQDELWKSMYAESSAGFLKVQEALAALAAMTREDGVRLRAVIFPELGADAQNYPFTEVHKVIKAALLANGIATRDLLPDYEQYGDWSELIVASEDQHPNGKGHEIATTAIYELLSEP